MPVRLPAEWEPQSAVQLTFPHASTDWASMLDEVMPVFLTLARTIARFQPVLIVCEDDDWVRAQLADIDPQRLLIFELASNDTWARDHGGITVEEDGKFLIWDFMFNGWGLKFAANYDNLLTRTLNILGAFQAPVRTGALVLEGGGIESDGAGTLMTTAECMLSPNRNPYLTKNQLEDEYKRLFGVERVLWLTKGFLAGDDTDSHIDTLARFIDVGTIAYVHCPDQNDEHYEELLAMEAELLSFRKADGTPYRLIPLPWPDPCYSAESYRLPATYANFLFVNGAVLVPVYRVPQDAAAIQLFRDIFPTHEIIPVDCRLLIEQHGSLHCVTMQYPAGVVSQKQM